MSCVISRTVLNVAHVEMDTDTYMSTRRVFILALFKCVSSTDFSRTLSKTLHVENTTALEMRRVFDNDGYVLFHLKPYLFYCFKHNLRTKSEATQAAIEFKVEPEDIPLSRVMFEPVVAAKLEPLRAYAALSYSALRHSLDTLPRKATSHAKHFIFTKMRFIINNSHYALDVDDIVNELLDKGVRNLLWAYPKVESSAHALNIIKRAISNNGVNLIHYHTRSNRGVVRRDEYGNFYSNIIPITDATEMALDTLVCPTVSNNLDTQVTVEQLVATRQAIRHFKSKRKRTVVAALMGMRSPKFTAWLQHEARPTHRMANDDLFETMAEKRNLSQYIKYLSAFSGYSTNEVIEVGKRAVELLRA